MTVLTVNTTLGTDDFERPNESPLDSPYTSWTTGSTRPKLEDGSAVLNSFASDTTRPETVDPDCFVQLDFDAAMASDDLTSFYVGARLTAHSVAANGYSVWLDPGTGGWTVRIRRGNAYTTIATAATTYGPVSGVRIECVGSSIAAVVRIDGVWAEAVSVDDATYTAAGYTGFGVSSLSGSPVGVEAFTWGSITPLTGAGPRLYGRLEPLAYDDANQDYALLYLAVALTAPREVFEIARADATHEHPWGRLLDPDTCPDELLDWLAIFAGVEFPPSTLTADEKRYRILQAAGRYRGTPRAVIEELQLVLTGTKTVYLGYHTPDEWHYTVGTIDSETLDLDAVERAVLAQKPVGMLVEVLSTDDWSSLVLGPTLIGYRDGDDYAVAQPTYPTCQSVLDAFATCQDLLDNNPI